QEFQDVLAKILQALLALHALGESGLTRLQPTLGLLRQEVARSQEAGTDDQQKQQQRPASIDGDRHAIRLAHRGEPHREQGAIRGKEFGSEVAYAVHRQLATIRANGGQRAFRVTRTLQIERALQLGQLVLDQPLQLAQLLLLLWVVGCQALQLPQLARQTGAGVAVRLQVALTVRQKKPALTRLGILDARYQGIGTLHDLHRVGGELRALVRAVQRAVAEEGDEQQSGDRRREAGQRPGRKQRPEAVGKGARGLI